MKMLNGSPHYDSFQEAYEALYPNKKRKPYKPKLEVKDKFLKKNVCQVCKKPLVWIEGTHTMACQNPKCKGFEHTRKDADGNEQKYYSPSYVILSDFGYLLASTISGESAN